MSRSTVLLTALVCLGGRAFAAESPRKVFAHYMGCFPATSGWLAQDMAKTSPLTNATGWVKYGGPGYINRPLMPFGFRQDGEANAALEIRRAIRAGLDGFAVDAWAGDNSAKQQFELLLKAAEAYGGRFQVTVCLDASCHGYGYDASVPTWRRFADTANYVLSFGDSPALARRDGRPLLFSYHSRFIAGEEGFDQIAAAWRDFRAAVTNEVFISGDIDSLVKWDDPKVDRAAAATFAAGLFEAVGGFLGTQGSWRLDHTVSDAIKAAGGEWAQPMFFQYQNGRGDIITDKGLDLMAGNWENARETESGLIQFVTWNDYGEETTLAPSYGTGYTVTRMNRHWAEWWKAGVEPDVGEDEVHVIFRRTANWTSESWPYAMRIRSNPPEPVLEVATLLTAPGTVVVPGYGEYPAPKGLCRRQFPLKDGDVRASVWREAGGASNEVCAVTAPECASGRRWREDYTLVAYGSNFEKDWALDFPGTDPLQWSEMGDADGDGMPNWFEMAFFGKFPDLSTAGAGDPNADSDGDGATNLEECERQTNPLVADEPYPVGFTWDAASLKDHAIIWNPARDARGRNAWLALREDGTLAATPFSEGEKRLLYDGNFSFPTNGTAGVRLGGVVGKTHAFAWRAPEAGLYAVDLRLSVPANAYGPAVVRLNIGSAEAETLDIAKGAAADWNPTSRWLEAGETVKVTFSRPTTFAGPVDFDRFRVTRAARAPRRMTWTDPAEGSFSDSTNWLVDGATPVDGGPGGLDTTLFVRSSGKAVTEARLGCDAVVSNLLLAAHEHQTDYDVTLDLGGHALDVLAQMDVTTRSYAPASRVTLRNGAIRVLGTAAGTTTWGAPNEDAGGLFFNRNRWQQAMANVTLERLSLRAVRGLPYAAFGLQGVTASVRVTDGSVLDVPVLSLEASDGDSLLDVTGTGSFLCATNGQASGAVATGLVSVGSRVRLRFADGGALRTRGLYFSGDSAIVFDGGRHVLTGVNNWGHYVAIGTGGTTHAAVADAVLAITNGATVEVSNAVRISGDSSVRVASGGSLRCTVENYSFSFASGLRVEVDDGLVESDWIGIGSGSILGVCGSNALVRARSGNCWGAKGGLTVGDGVVLRFALPRDGFCDGTGTARAPIRSDGYLLDASADAPPAVSLATADFDKAHPQTAQVLVSAAGESRAALEKLAANATWDAPRHGTLSVSADGRQLVYTSCARPGMSVLVK